MPSNNHRDERLNLKNIKRATFYGGAPSFDKAQAESDLFEQVRESFRKANTEQEDMYVNYERTRIDAKTKLLRVLQDILSNYGFSLADDSRTRITFAKGIFVLVVVWLLIVILLIVAAGIQHTPPISDDEPALQPMLAFIVGDNVLIALITSASISLIGLLGTVLTYFFTRSNEQIALYETMIKTIMIDEEAIRKGSNETL